MEPQIDDPVIDRLTIKAYEATKARKVAAKTETEERNRLKMAMELKGLKYYKASDGTEAKYPEAERKLKLHRDQEGEEETEE